MEFFGESFELPAMASAAGLGGGAIGAITAALLFKGVIMRFLAQLVMTTIMTGIGFWALLHFLGYQIVANPDVEQKLDLGSILSNEADGADGDGDAAITTDDVRRLIMRTPDDE